MDPFKVKMIKIAHIADIHFRGYKRHVEYKKSMQDFFEKCRAQNPDIILIAGDIVHSKTQNITPELIEMLSWWFTNLAAIAPTVVTLGNHDGLLTNLSRQDTISPVISALNNDRITLYKSSGIYPILNGQIDLCVFSPFDEESWKNNYKNKSDKISIATFHGVVNGCKTDESWELTSQTNTSFFSEYDYVMLGDIHKRQDLDELGKISYPGSMIQQNFGEDISKGFLIWEIEGKNNFSKKFIEIKNDSPFVNLNWKYTLENSLLEAGLKEADLKNCKIRIKTPELLNQLEVQQIQKKLSAVGVKETYFKFESLKEERKRMDNDSLISISKDPISLANYVAEQGYYDSNNENLKNKIIEIIKTTEEKLSLNDTKVGDIWSIKEMHWDNTFGYGEKNYINFDALNGLVGIFGQNRIGKSSIPATILYSLFNTNDRGLTKNIDIVNVRKDYCKSKVSFSKNNNKFESERMTTKKSNKKGEDLSTTYLNLNCYNELGEIIHDLNGEQRRDTDKELQNLIGTADDFILTAFATQGDRSNFIESGPTQRKEILAKFLQLDFFNDLYNQFKEKSLISKNIMQNSQSKLEKIDPKKLIKEIKEITEKRKEINLIIEENQNNLIAVSLKETDILFKTEKIKFKRIFEENLKKIKKIEKEIQELQNKMNLIVNNKDSILNKINENREQLVKINSVELEKQLDYSKDLKNLIKNLDTQLESKKAALETLKKSVNILKTVPCEDNFPNCKFIKDSYENREKIEPLNLEIKNLQNTIKSTQKTLTGLDEENIKNQIKIWQRLSETNNKLKEESQRNDLDSVSLKSKIDLLKYNLENEIKNNEEINKKWSFDNDESSLDDFSNPIDNIKKAIEKLKKEENKLSESIGSINLQIGQAKELANQLKSYKLEFDAYEVLLKSFSKTGIPAQLVNSSLPIINRKLKEILLDDAGFSLTLESEDNSKKMQIYIDYGDSKRKIECASGMEKMISSLALRTALHSITQIPKPDFMIIDEGFGALDDSNVEVCVKMMRTLLSYYRFILIISHIDTIKEAVDHMIEVQRDSMDSKVYYA